MECVDDFGGKLPTLDLSIWVMEDNTVVYIFYEKPMASSMVIQKRSAMPENMQMSSLNQEVIRRMLNTSERLEDAWRIGIVDDYARKLMNSGYELNYTRKVMLGGLTGYERKLGLSKKTDHPKWKPLHQGAKFNAEGRKRKKMLAKVNWFKKRKSSEEEGESPAKRKRATEPMGEQVLHGNERAEPEQYDQDGREVNMQGGQIRREVNIQGCNVKKVTEADGEGAGKEETHHLEDRQASWRRRAPRGNGEKRREWR